MARIKMDVKGNPFGIEGNTSFEAEGGDNLVAGAFRDFAGILAGKPGAVEVIATPQEQPQGTVWDVVAIYDDFGIPSIMHRFRKITNKELFGGSDKINPAFIIGDEIVDELYISVYENCNIGGRPYSLPYMKAWTNITNDDAAKACFSKGAGWHMLTAAEWGLLANTSLKNGTLPHGNTNAGEYHADASEHGEVYDSCYTLTGSGPATWTHDHTPTGVHDLCGNHWEMVRGLRVRNGVLEAAKNNDAAMDIDLTPDGSGWQGVVDDSVNKKYIRVSVNDDDEISLITDGSAEEGYTGSRWGDVKIVCESEQLKELALYPGEPDAYLWMDSTNGEYFALRGGSWSSGSSAGVFYSHFTDARSVVGASVGFRSAYYVKH